MLKQLYTLAFCAAATAGLSAQTTLNKTILHDGITREYMVYIPAIYDGSTAVPLLFNLHGYTSNNAQQNFYANFKPIADTANFIMVLPNGTFDLSNNRYWSVGFAASPINDVGFLELLIDSLSATYNIDATRIYSTGMSNGGFMSYEMACASSRIAAIASVTGSITPSHFGTCSPSHPTPVMEIHGTADGTVPYEGGVGFSMHIDTVVAYWVNYNNCPTPPTLTNVPDIAALDGATAEHYVYAAGDGGATVELYKVIGGAHTWPGSAITIGVTCMDFNACAEIWRFFSQYTLIQTTGQTVVEMPVHTGLSLFPNPAGNELNIAKEGVALQQISIIDLNGKTLRTETANTRILSLEGLAAGIYFVRGTDGKNWYSGRFVKM